MRGKIKIKRRIRPWLSALLAGIMLFAVGCSGGEGIKEQQKAGSDSLVSPAAGDQDVSMGRYLEQEIILPDEVGAMGTYPTAYLKKLNNGELVLIEQVAGLYISSDNGQTWTAKETSWYDEIKEFYIAQIALSPDGAMAVIYDPVSEDNAYTPQYLYADPDGNVQTIEYPDQENWLHQLWFGKDGRLYGYAMDDKVYEMDISGGRHKELFETEGLSDYVCFTDRYMIVIASRGASVYDLETGMPTEEDKILTDFIQDAVGDAVGADTDAYRMVMEEGEQEDVVYLAYAGGIYRHVIGGSAMEQVADGSINSLGDPMMSLAGFAVLPDNQFAVLYDQARLYKYVYDPNIPTVPEEQISIYSLKEDYTIRQAVSLFQKKHPETCVRYEIGLSGGNGMTQEDAVKNLNTKIMSGSGPELLVLDGLPAASYEEKGVLTDLSGIVHDMEGEAKLFKNLVDACRTDGKLWYVPVRFRLPLLVGDKDDIEKVTDLTSLADVVEELRSANPEGAIIGLRTEDEVLRTLKMISSAAWIDADTGEINKEKLTEFLTCARRIYQAEIAGMDEDELKSYKVEYEEHWSSDLTAEGMYYAVASANAIDLARKTQKLGAGVTYRMDGEFNIVTSIKAQEENFAYAPWQGQVKDGFIPRGMVGICASAEENELAMEFFRFLYGEELQDIDLPTGYPVNQASFEKLRENPRKDDFNEGIGIVLADSESDTPFALEIKWSSEEDFGRLKEMAETASVVCTGDTRIEDVVCDVGVKALHGSVTIEDAVDEIVKRAGIYLAE